MEEKVKTLQTIHLAICVGVAIAYYFIGNINTEILNTKILSLENIPYILIPIGAIIVSKSLFKTQLKQIDKELTIEENLPIYQTASILQWAIIEGAAFAILFLKPDCIIIGIITILYLVNLRPTESSVNEEMGYGFLR
jgi:hypothetical protein